MAEVEMTIEPETSPASYVQHMITVQRSGPEWEGVTGCLFLTDGELDQLAVQIGRYRESAPARPVTVRFDDATGKAQDHG